MPTHRGFSASIEVEGQPLEEFSVEQDPGDERVSSCWIPSEEGKVFQIRVNSTLPEAAHYRIHVNVDGKSSGRHIARHGQERRVLGHRITKETVREYAFTKLVMTDDESAIKNADDIGCISLRIFSVRSTGQRNGKVRGWLTASGFEREKTLVHEQAKKLGCHAVSLGGSVYAPASTHHQFVSIDSNDNRPHVSFKFFYRPLDILQAMNHAPLLRNEAKFAVSTGMKRKRSRSRSPAKQIRDQTFVGGSGPVKRSIMSMKQEAEYVGDSDEEQRVQAEIQAKQCHLQQIRLRKRPKPEPSQESITPLRFDANGVIDLTLN